MGSAPDSANCEHCVGLLLFKTRCASTLGGAKLKVLQPLSASDAKIITTLRLERMPRISVDILTPVVAECETNESLELRKLIAQCHIRCFRVWQDLWQELVDFLNISEMGAKFSHVYS